MNAYRYATILVLWSLSTCAICHADNKTDANPNLAQLDELEDPSNNQNFHPCATDPTYKYIERIQFLAYQSDPMLKKLLDAQRNNAELLRTIKETGEFLDRRDRTKGTKASLDSEKTNRYLRKVLAEKLPTCYESPPAYYIFHTYQKQLDPARASLYGQSADPPKLATIPSTEINAYTYPGGEDRGSIVAFNSELMNFAWQMTKVTLPTINIEQGKKLVKIDHSSAYAKEAIEKSSTLKANYANAILEFLLLLDPKTETLSPSYDPLVITFASGMEMFAVAHEYGHVIKGHHSSTTSIPLGASGGNAPGQKVSVYDRSWDQEFEADEVGVHLIAETLSRPTNTDWMKGQGWVFKARGTLFFFKCLDIIDAATYMRDHGHARKQPTLQQRVALRNIADGTSRAKDRASAKDWLSDSHPPPWLRLERARIILEREIRQRAAAPTALATADIATGILDNIDLIGDSTADRMQVAIDFAKKVRDQQQAGHKLDNADYRRYLLDAMQNATNAGSSTHSVITIRPGCAVEPANWEDTFLCSPALQRAVVEYGDSPTPGADLLPAYMEAIKDDPVLLTGEQITWAKQHLDTSSIEMSKYALAVLALAGDISATDTLRNFIAQSPPEEISKEANKSLSFLSRFGRDTSLVTSAGPDTLAQAPGSYLVFPKDIDSQEIMKRLRNRSPEYGDEAFLGKFASFDPNVTFAPAVFARLISRAGDAKTMADIVDVLTQYGRVDDALTVARFSDEKFGSDPDLENIYGNALLKHKDYALAREHYLASLKAGRTDGWPENNVGQTYADEHQIDDAEIWFRKSLQRKGQKRSPADFTDQINRFAWFLAQNRAEDSKKAKEALALSELSNALVRNSDPNFLDTLAECLSANGKATEAVAASRAALALVGENSEKHSQYAERLTEFQKRLESATEKPNTKKVKGPSNAQ
jgi:hypothetical protein